MIFAEIDYPGHYSEAHAELAAFIGRHFSDVRAGLQCDSWILIRDGAEEILIDSFTSMKHQVKAAKPTDQLRRIIELLSQKYILKIHEPPELEGHEDEPEDEQFNDPS